VRTDAGVFASGLTLEANEETSQETEDKVKEKYELVLNAET
jgi:hypothetical protein